MLDVYVSAYTHNKELTSFGVYMRHDSGEHLNVVDLGDTTKNNAELQAVKYAAAATVGDTSKIDIHIRTLNAYIYGMFQIRDGDWVSSPKKNVEDVEQARELLKKYKSFLVTLRKNDDHIIKLNSIQKKKREVSDKI